MSNRTLHTAIGWVLLATLLLVGLGPVTAQDGPGSMESEGMGASADYKAGEILVKFKAGASILSANALLDQADAGHVRTLEGVGVEVWQVPQGQELAMAERLSADPAVEFAEPNYRYYAFETGSTPNDTYYYRQWAHTIVNSPAAWDVTTGSASVVIAIIDTGIDLNHPDLAGKVVAGYDFVGGDAYPWDENGHGTHVAGIAAAQGNNGLGVAGMDWQARIMPVRVLDATGAGYSDDIVDGIIWARDHGAKVLNLSLGGPSYSQAMQNAVTTAHDAGRLVVAAMGNCRTISSVCPVANPTNYPAAYANVMAVAATGPTDVYAFYSQYGSHCDIAAPGGSMSSLHDPNGIYSTMPTYAVALNSSGFYRNYDFVHGTSQAAPYVSGLAALIWAQSPTLTPVQVQNVIQNTAFDLGAVGWDPNYGHGRIDAGAALGNVSPPDAPTLSPISNADGDGAYTVAWNSVPWATSYTLQQSSSSTFATATTLYTGTSTQFAVTGQPAGTTRYYRVRASNANGYSAWSNVQSVTTKPAAPVLNAISNTGQEDAYVVSWQAATGATEYTLWESSNNSACSGATLRYQGTALSYSVTGQPNETWYYCVQASNAAGDSPMSGSRSTTVLVQAIAAPILSAISNADGDGDYTVAWSSVGAANSYTLEVANNPYFVDPTEAYSGSGTSHGVTGQPEGRWYYRVRAFSADARSPWSNSQSVSVHSKVYLPYVVRNYVGTAPSSNWVTVMEEDFEGAFPGALWQVFDNNDTVLGPKYGEYYWGKRNCLPYAGSYSAWAVGAGLDGSSLSCGSSYPNNASSWMIYGPFSLADAVEAELTYQAWVNVLAPGDSLCHMASVDDTNYYGSCTTALFPQSQWTARTFDLTNVYTLGDLTGRPQVWIALIFGSDGADTRPHGAYADNLLLRKNVGAAASDMSGQSSTLADWEEPAARTITR